MKWEEFLNHPQVISDTKLYLSQPSGAYLYKKVLHDMLECLTGYKGFMEIAFSIHELPNDTRQWFFKWEPSVETWISSLTSLSEKSYQNGVEDNTAWPELIAELVSISVEVSVQQTESKEITLPVKEPARDLIKKAISSIDRLNLICHYIQNQEYVQLWTSNY